MIKEEFDLTIHGHNFRACYVRHNKPVPAHYPTLVFMHDSLGCIELWRDFPEKLALATGLNAFIYDRQGYGKSDPFSEPRTLDYLQKEADVLARMLEQVEIDSAIIFGHSDGGSIGLIAAAEYPEKVACVISEAAHVFVDRLTIQGILNTKAVYQNTNLRERIARYHGNKAEAVFFAWTETWLAEWYQGWSIEKFLARIQCPVLAIQGELDEFGTQSQLYSIVRHVGGIAQPCLLPGVGHTPHKDMPEPVIEVTAQFISDTVPLKG